MNIPEFDKVTYFWCDTCSKLLHRGHLKLHRFRKYHLKNLEKVHKK